MVADETWFAVRFNTKDGDEHHAICKSVDELENYVRVNARDLLTMQISATTPTDLARWQIEEDHGLEP